MNTSTVDIYPTLSRNMKGFLLDDMSVVAWETNQFGQPHHADLPFREVAPGRFDLAHLIVDKNGNGLIVLEHEAHEMIDEAVRAALDKMTLGSMDSRVFIDTEWGTHATIPARDARKKFGVRIDTASNPPDTEAWPDRYHHPKVSLAFTDAIMDAKEGQIVGVLGNFLRGPKIRQRYEKALSTPVMVLNRPIQKGKKIEYPEFIEFYGGTGKFRGKQTIFISNLYENELVKTLLHEGAHVVFSSRGMSFPPSDLGSVAGRSEYFKAEKEKMVDSFVDEAWLEPEDEVESNPPKENMLKLFRKGNFFRFQPKGLPILGWTSEASTDVLPEGKIFAYEAEHPYLALEWFDANNATDEVVFFKGKGVYDPGDAEGVAVTPISELARISVVDWLKAAAKKDPNNEAGYFEKVDEESNPTYAGIHRAPTGEHDEGSLDAMDRTYPDDVYAFDAARIYGDRVDVRLDSKVAALIRRYRGKPEALVTVYRAAPAGVATEINPGDWVTPIREYAEMHGERFEEGYDIIERTVKAGELFTEGNSLFEFGWMPKSLDTAHNPSYPNPVNALRDILGEIQEGKQPGLYDFGQVLRWLDIALTGRTMKNMHDYARSAELMLDQTRGEFYLSDGGYSRVWMDLDEGEAWVTDNSTAEVKRRWKALAEDEG